MYKQQNIINIDPCPGSRSGSRKVRRMRRRFYERKAPLFQLKSSGRTSRRRLGVNRESRRRTEQRFYRNFKKYYWKQY